MDDRQSKLEPDLRQTDSSELPSSNLNDHDYLHSAEEDNTTGKENKSVEISEAAAEVDPEWRQFVQQELESMRNLENAGRDRAPAEKSSPVLLDQAVLLIEKIPLERLINSTIRFLFKPKPAPKPERRVKKHRRK